MYTYSRNTYFFHDGKDQRWAEVNKHDIHEYRARMVEYLRDIERDGAKLVWEEGMDSHVPVDMRRGLIMTGGDGVSGLGYLAMGAQLTRRKL